MNYRYQNPHQVLSEYVRTVLILEEFQQSEADKVPFFTNGMAALLCRTEKDENGNENIIQLTLFGKSVPAECWSTNDATTIIAYFFKPFALASIFNISASELIEVPIELDKWNPHKANAFKMQLIYAGLTNKKIEVVDNLLIHQLQENSRDCEIIKYATDQIMCNPHTEVLSVIQEELNLNERTFQRIFKKYVGITPIQYRRICQFQLSFTQVKAQKFSRLTDVAYENGFADQSHFIRSFREFTQITPNDYLRFGLKKKNQ